MSDFGSLFSSRVLSPYRRTLLPFLQSLDIVAPLHPSRGQEKSRPRLRYFAPISPSLLGSPKQTPFPRHPPPALHSYLRPHRPSPAFPRPLSLHSHLVTAAAPVLPVLFFRTRPAACVPCVPPGRLCVGGCARGCGWYSSGGERGDEWWRWEEVVEGEGVVWAVWCGRGER
jgi:hypothetical protein